MSADHRICLKTRIELGSFPLGLDGIASGVELIGWPRPAIEFRGGTDAAGVAKLTSVAESEP